MSENTIKVTENKQEEARKFPMQRILFGSPGTGKSHKIHDEYLKEFESGNVFKTVFHPEYKYGDFMGRLIPKTKGGNVFYEYQAGHFMKALAQAYKNLFDETVEPVALVIDELNRGNSSAIFGTIFQLLDRDESGWSSYELDLSDIEKDCLIKAMDYQPIYDVNSNVIGYKNPGGADFEGVKALNDEILLKNKNNKIRIPPNLSIMATINTSDESIYYMDSAFKRRWDWEFVSTDGELKAQDGVAFDEESEWNDFSNKLNSYIKCNSKHIRKVEDKLIGKYFIKAPCCYSTIQSKLMFFLWDSVFSQDKQPLKKLLGGVDLITFGDFANKVTEFVSKIKEFDCSKPDKDENK